MCYFLGVSLVQVKQASLKELNLLLYMEDIYSSRQANLKWLTLWLYEELHKKEEAFILQQLECLLLR